MATHITRTRHEWLAARLDLLTAEKELTRRSDERARRRQGLPWVRAAGLGAADWLCLAAAPAFAIMALLTGLAGDGPQDMLCSAASDASPLSGMVPMYLMMSAFHSAPWLKLLSHRRSGASLDLIRVRGSQIVCGEKFWLIEHVYHCQE